MTDHRGPFLPDPRRGLLDSAEREARHAVLIDLLAAYVDRELPAETESQIEAHLVGCAQCRREVGLHEALRGRLAVEPPSAASPDFRARIARAIDAAPAPALPAAPELAPAGHAGAPPLVPRRVMVVLCAAAAVILALLVGAQRWVERDRQRDEVSQLAIPARSVPLVSDVLADYRRVTAGDLPGRARDLAAVREALPFPVEPLRASELRLLAAWTTDLRGEPAGVLAYRMGDHLVVQYVVSEATFFRDPAMRAGVAARHLLAASDGSQGVVAWPSAESGLLLVGDVPAHQLASVRRAEEE